MTEAGGRFAAARQLLRRVQVLELAARRNVAALQSGDYATSILGQGMLFEESRKYVAGQPARWIDWNVTARTGEPYIKVHRQERQRDVFLAVDVSPSMHTGFQGKTKLEFMVELAATLGVSAVEAGDRLGLVVFADEVLTELRPRSGQRQLFRVLRELLHHTAPWERPVAVSDPRTAIHALQRHRGKRFVVFLLSDFLDYDLPEDLKFISTRHDVSLLHIYDPVEYAPDEEGGLLAALLPAFSPEGPDGGVLARGAQARRGWVRPGKKDDLPAMQRFLESHGARYRIDSASLSTAQGVPAGLTAFLHRKRRRQVR